MGQRLVVNIKKTDKIIAAMYFHWSGYPYSSLEETSGIVNAFDEDNLTDEKNIILKLIRYIESKGGCIDGASEESDEFKYVQAQYPEESFKTEGDRSDGLIAISEDGINEVNNLSEGTVNIDIDSGFVENELLSVYARFSISDLNENIINEDDKLDESSFIVLPYNPENCSIEEFKEIYKIINDNIDKHAFKYGKPSDENHHYVTKYYYFQ